MKYECIGVSFRKGQFTNQETGQVIDYNNVVFHCIHDSIDDSTYGMQYTGFKIKRNLLEYNENEIKQFIGHDVSFDLVPNGQKFEIVGINLVN